MNDDIEKMPTTVKSSRKASKPMMEKRRRARINQSLSELKDLVTSSSQYEINNCRRSKLEKADILEMTVRHLHHLHHRAKSGGHRPTAGESEEDPLDKFRAGFHECVNEVNRYLNEKQLHLDSKVHVGLTAHLNSRLNHLQFANNGCDRRASGGGKTTQHPTEDNVTNRTISGYANQCPTNRTFSAINEEQGQRMRNSPMPIAHIKEEMDFWRPW